MRIQLKHQFVKIQRGEKGLKSLSRPCIFFASLVREALPRIEHFSRDVNYEAVAFEQANRIGGVWNYPQGCEERLDMDQASPYFSRMYKNMRTLLPQDLMSLEGFPFPPGGQSYCDVETVQQYLGSYAQHFGLSPFIKTGHRVSSITPILVDGEEPSVGIGPRWTVESVDLQTKSKTEEIFDAVLVCTGKYHHPYIPEISGLPEYKGTVLHSSVYRGSGALQEQSCAHYRRRSVSGRYCHRLD
ncbi:putative Senecionine N-oxygenase [Hypsibius exemplaris]|uniref:Flavin-containing monooxygenase n=1 Tax=Hypsibius exemplaris TaxID=2072580 RepID=A0A9X6NC73_HYPEX|nr:putative Senecionine N-oxygenase [Hypsibius exemplaris]